MTRRLFALPILCLSSCFLYPDLNYTTTHVYFKNETVHEIAVVYYYTKDSIRMSDTLRIGSKSTQEKFNWDRRNGNFAEVSVSDGGRYVCDSAQAIFDAIYPVSHYGITSVDTASKYYGYSSRRNIFNWDSYCLSRENVSKRHTEDTYVYTFTDSDYVYATQ